MEKMRKRCCSGFSEVLGRWAAMRGLFFLFMGMMIAVVAPEEAMAVFTQVAAGGYHSVALMEDGTVMTWGDNGNGQLGDGTTTDRLTPVLVPGLTGVKAIAAGWLHSMALLTNGTVMTWGSNGNGQLGDGTTTYRSTPVRVLGLTGVKSIAAGLIHSMAILNDGTVMTWGLNRDGQLGDGTTTDRLTPVFVPGLTGVNSIAAGSRFSLALLNDGTVRAWGSNNYGQLGDGTRTDRLTPVPVSRLSGVVALAAGGEHTVALLDTGTLMAWGKSLSGQLGTQNIISTIPALVQGLAGVTAIATGDTHTVALLGDGTVKAWGDNSLGQMGDGTTTDRFTLFSVPGMSNVKTLAGGYYHSLALLRDGTIMAWGSNSNGQLGNGTKRNRLTPTEVPAVAGAANIVAGWQHTLALLRDGTARAWGLNSEGQLGDGTRTDRFTPVMVPGLVGAVDIAASWGHNVALMTDGTVRAWGWNIFGQLGDGTTNNHFTPVQVPGLVGAIDIAAGGAHTVALLNNGTVMTWGANGQGALGDGTTTNRLTPVPVPGLAGVKAVVAGDAHTLVLLQDGTVRAWGINDFGQLGDGTTTNRLTPVPVPGIAGVKAVSTGVNHTVALMTDGTVRAWGRNSEGELGDGTGLYRLSPTPVPNLASVSAIAVGSYHTLVLLNDGTLKTWGYNEYGQLGDGTTINRFTPVPVPGVTNALAIAAGASHSLALLRDGTVMSWGYNGFGQLGSGWSTAPTVVGSPLTITKEGGGVGAVTASSGTIAWDGNQGQTLYPYGATITLSAKPSACSEFTGWSGDCTGTGVCTVTMDIPKNVTATFVAHPDLLTAIFYRDADGDGYGNPAISTAGCPGEPPLGYVTDNTDCNDAVPSINSGASEICDGIDNNCNGLIDDADPNLMAATFWFADADADTYGNPNVTKKSCARPVGYVADKTDCNDADPASYPGATEICNDGIDNNCDGKIDAADPLCSDVGGIACLYDAQCGANEYCMKKTGDCNGVGQCWPLPAPGTMCPLTLVYAPVCGCDGKTYPGACEAGLVGVNVAAKGECATAGYKWTYYFPAAKDNDAIGWENYLSVQAKNPVAMDVTIRAYDMNGVLKGTYVYSDTVTGANAPAIAPNARVAQRPSWIAGSMMSPIAIEGSLIVETSVPAIASTNFIANFYKGFSIYEAAKVRPVHYFPKAFDGPNNYQVYMLVQNIYDAPRNVTVKLFGKNVGDPGDGMARTVDIPAHGTLKVRPSEIAGGIDFNGSVVVYSNQAVAEDGLGLPIPAMCSYEAGAEALAIYESTARQPQLAFPVLKDGKFGGTIDYQNFLSVVNMNPTDATITMILYNKAGVEEGRLASDVIPSGGKKTWRLGWIKGTMAAPLDFEGSVIVTSDKVLIGQTNTIYPGANKYGADGFDLIESAMPAANLFFPKAFDNLLGSGTGATHLIDNFVYVQNLDGTAKNFKIEQFNNNGTANGYAEVALAPNATYVYRPKELVTDGTSTFRGSVKVTERSGKKITGAIKYEVHKTTVATSAIDAMTIYRSMGQ